MEKIFKKKDMKLKEIKKIYLTKEQVNEALDVNVDVQNGNVGDAVRKTKQDTQRELGSQASKVNYVIPSNELNEGDVDNNVFQSCVTEFWNNYNSNPDAENIYTNGEGYFNKNEVMSALSEYYEDKTGQVLFDNPEAEKNMAQEFLNSIRQQYGECRTYTKRQIEESKRRKLQENMITMSKKDLKKVLNELKK